MRPSATAAVIHGMTSSSISSSVVVHSKPSTSRALSTDGMRFCTSCSKPGSCTKVSGASPLILRQISAARSVTVVDSAVEMLKSSLRAASADHAGDDSLGEVTAIRVVPDLASVAEDVQRILALHHLLHQIGNHVTHGELHVARGDVDVAERPRLTDADTVERAHDRVGQLVLVLGGPSEILDRQLLESVGRQRRRTLARHPPPTANGPSTRTPSSSTGT